MLFELVELYLSIIQKYIYRQGLSGKSRTLTHFVTFEEHITDNVIQFLIKRPQSPLVTTEVDSPYHLFPRASRRQETKNQPRLKRLTFAFDHLLSVIFIEILSHTCSHQLEPDKGR